MDMNAVIVAFAEQGSAGLQSVMVTGQRKWTMPMTTGGEEVTESRALS